MNDTVSKKGLTLVFDWSCSKKRACFTDVVSILVVRLLVVVEVVEVVVVLVVVEVVEVLVV